MDKILYICLFVLCVFISSCAQIVLKRAAMKERRGMKAYLNIEVVCGYGIFLGITICTTYLYRYIELSVGSLLDSLGYVFVVILSVIFLNERMNKRKFFGMCLIFVGVLICIE